MFIIRTPYQRNDEKKQTFADEKFSPAKAFKKEFQREKICLMRIYCIWSALIKCWPNRLIYVFIDDENSSGSHCFCRTCIFSYFLHFHPMLLILYPIINLICFFFVLCVFLLDFRPCNTMIIHTCAHSYIHAYTHFLVWNALFDHLCSHP